jgi:hypothetical protein
LVLDGQFDLIVDCLEILTSAQEWPSSLLLLLPECLSMLSATCQGRNSHILEKFLAGWEIVVT